MKELLFKLTGLIVLIGSFSAGWLWMELHSFQENPLQIDKEQVWSIAQGETLGGIAKRLEQRGIIKQRRYFVWLARVQGTHRNIKAGDYLIKPGDSVATLLEKMVSGAYHSYTLTLVEGSSFSQIMARIRASGDLLQSLEGMDSGQIMTALGHAGEHPEGRFFPDTYHFPRGTQDRDFLQRAYLAMEQRLQQEWLQRSKDLPLKSPYEALILASIVEKETGSAHERDEIAGVFVRRLRRRMRLQTDPTVIYGVGESYKGNIRRKDLRRDTPYNTYTRYGLPPTPITMPGGEAIHAALHPAEGTSLYFVAKGDGSHYFSSTLEEHNRAVIKYQLKGRKRNFSSYSNQ